jgi:aminoglycoside phosphotransferase (APT) family kinase protein
VSDPTPVDKASWKVISPPPPLPIEAADALLEEWRGGRHVISATPLKGGIMNWNYSIRLSGSPDRRFVMRFYARQPASCAKEVRLLSTVRDDVPVPAVLHFNAIGAIGWPPFCVLEFIDGISLRELRAQGKVKGVGEASYDIGRLLYLYQLTRHRFPRCGILNAELEVQDGPFAGASLVQVVDHFVSSPAFLRRIDRALTGRILERVRTNNAESAAMNAEATLVHGDFNSPNILVRDVAGTWRVAAILDWEFAFAANIFVDIGNMLRYELPGEPRYEPHFSQGLMDAGWKAPTDWFEQARLADLPALCELLTREDVPDAVVDELRKLIDDE